jgi:hypothetical protein
MKQLTLADYWMHRDVEYPLAMTPDIEHNAEILVDVLNGFMPEAEMAGAVFTINPATGSLLSSGWRPPAVNAATPHAAPNSKHMTGQAADLYGPGNVLALWAQQHQDLLKKHGLWMEAPSATPTWLHLQTVPPRSGNRVFFP